MRVIAFSTIRAFIDRQPSTAPALLRWNEIMRRATFETLSSVQAAFPKAEVLNADRVRFEVAGGQYRLIAAFDFEKQIVFVKFLGTHGEDDAVDAKTVARFLESAMEIMPIDSDADHRAALVEIDRLWGAARGTPAGDKLDVLVTLVSAYEDKRYPIPPVDPIAILEYAITEMGRSQGELAALLGSRARASENPEPKAGLEPRPDPYDQRGMAPADRPPRRALSPGEGRSVSAGSASAEGDRRRRPRLETRSRDRAAGFRKHEGRPTPTDERPSQTAIGTISGRWRRA